MIKKPEYATRTFFLAAVLGAGLLGCDRTATEETTGTSGVEHRESGSAATAAEAGGTEAAEPATNPTDQDAGIDASRGLTEAVTGSSGQDAAPGTTTAPHVGISGGEVAGTATGAESSQPDVATPDVTMTMQEAPQGEGSSPTGDTNPLSSTDPPNVPENQISSGGSDSTAGVGVEDNLLTTQVKAALLADGDVRDDNINVQVEQGAVTLSGSVENPEQAERAVQLANSVQGVRGVQNELKIGN